MSLNSKSRVDLSGAADDYQQHGWCRFGADADVLQWVHHALPAAEKAISASQHRHWFRYQNTWFVGVNALPNNDRGQVENGPPLQGQAADFIRQKLKADMSSLDQAQVSAIFAGYPKPSETEPETFFNYRLRRDAAHIDGLLKDSTVSESARFAREYHEYILAIGMTNNDNSASPLVVWRGSHAVFQSEFVRFFAGYEAKRIGSTDISGFYRSVRKRVLESCERVELPLQRGESVVAHRMLLHGTAPWRDRGEEPRLNAQPNTPRILCFFRPITLTADEWLTKS